jgi:hypothetical protein
VFTGLLARHSHLILGQVDACIRCDKCSRAAPDAPDNAELHDDFHTAFSQAVSILRGDVLAHAASCYTVFFVACLRAESLKQPHNHNTHSFD